MEVMPGRLWDNQGIDEPKLGVFSGADNSDDWIQGEMKIQKICLRVGVKKKSCERRMENEQALSPKKMQ